MGGEFVRSKSRSNLTKDVVLAHRIVDCQQVRGRAKTSPCNAGHRDKVSFRGSCATRWIRQASSGGGMSAAGNVTFLADA